MRRSVPTAPLAAFAFLLSACSDDGAGPEIPACEAETSSVAVTVGREGGLTFDWSPDCAVFLVIVEEQGSDRWGISTEEDSWNSTQGNRIVPPLSYGVAPAGIDEFKEAEELVAGTTYQLILWRALPPNSEVQCIFRFGRQCLLAAHEFTP